MARPSITVRPFAPADEPGLDNDPMWYLTKVFVYFLENLFRDFPEGSGMKWRPTEETSEIIISAEKPVLQAIEKRPHITCVLGSGRWSGIGLDQFQTHRASDGQRTHTDLIPMTMAYHCQAAEGLVARRIAWNASFFTVVLRRLIMRTAGLFQVGVTHDISAESGLTAFTGKVAESDLVSVVVTVPFYWQPQWRISRPSTVWRRLEIGMKINDASPIFSAGRTTLLRPPKVRGRVVSSYPIDPPGTAFEQTVVDTSYAGEEEE